MRLKNLPAAALGLLLTASIVGYFWTRDGIAPPPRPAGVPAPQQSLMDQRLLQTARQLSSTAETPDERVYATVAARLADHELDQAFATALREAATVGASLPPQLQQLAAQVAQLRAKVARDQDRVQQLQKENPDSEAYGLAKAQLALDQDDLDDAQGRLARRGGDPRAAIQRALQEHEDAQKIGVEPARAPLPSGDTLSAHLRVWLALGSLRSRVAAARQEAAAKSASLDRQHDALEKAHGAAASPTGAEDDEDVAAAVARLSRLSDQAKTLRELDARIQDTQRLSNVYGRWETEVAARRRAAAHDLLRSIALVLAVILGAFLGSGAIRRGVRLRTDRRRAHQLRFMASLAVQIAAAGIVLLLVFGPPTQLSTIVGLATAGITLVLKDFIVAFLGWFVLMGRNGLRIGDWVEIQGVSGEVIEIGVLRTVLLEMGNWTDAGHPTGRRVGFNNTFAIEGHYFNFSTAGQWLWDELRVPVPPSADPYRVAEEVREVAERATQEDAGEAAQEWERVTRQYGSRPFSAGPAIDLQPGQHGLEVVVRYITHAPQRNERKSRLLHEIIGLLHGRVPPPATAS